MTATTDRSIDSAFGSRDGRAAPFHTRNRNAIVLWLFMSMWTLGLLIAIAMTVRSDASIETWQWVILAVFALGGIVGCVFASSLPIVSMHAEGNQVRVVERRPFSSRTTRCVIGDIAVPAISEDDVDTEGDPYFHCFLLLPDGRRVEVAASHRRCEVQALRTRILVALATQGEVALSRSSENQKR